MRNEHSKNLNSPAAQAPPSISTAKNNMIATPPATDIATCVRDRNPGHINTIGMIAIEKINQHACPCRKN